ncbi:MAG: DUF362 domain-containing protein, partial [Candidatus Methanomethyliaceae archaeon]
DELLSHFIQYFNPESKIAIKVHIGERGNYTYIRPFFIRKIVDFLKDFKMKPFITETTALYPTGFRRDEKEVLETAKYNGFTEEGLSCPIIVADGPYGEDGIDIEIESPFMNKIRIAKAIFNADGLIIVSHVKGHLLSGFGGAIKNLAMGCTTKISKRDQHAAHGIVFQYEKCNNCGKCIMACAFSAISMKNGMPKRDENKCMYCGNCMFSCDQNAITIFENGKERFQEALAYAASGVLKGLKNKPIFFMNFLIDITPLCDCATPAGNIITQNIGILASKDPVAIDEASLDLIDESPIFPNLGITPPDPLGKINGTNSRIQIITLEKLGYGSREYKLIKI